MRPQRHTLTKRLLTGDAKATFNQAALDIGIRTVDKFNKEIGLNVQNLWNYKRFNTHFCICM